MPTPSAKTDVQRVTFIVFSGELDRLLAAFTMATGAAACGMEVRMFFTFWGTALLRTEPSRVKKTVVERCFGWMLPGGPGGARLSRMNMGGVGRWLMAREMQRKRMASLDELVQLASESGVRFSVCDSSMHLMGIDASELRPGVQLEMCGVAHLWDQAAGGQTIFV